jgi:hypothetical protein
MAFMTSRTPVWALFALLGACAGTPKQVTTVARTDLGCEQVETAEIAPNRYAASGCGRGGVYAQLCGGGECSWVRLRGSETPQHVAPVTSGADATGSAPAREIVQAPPPAPREIIQAPPPAQREIIPAPPPEGQSTAPAPASATPTDANQAVPSAADGSSGQLQPYTPEPTPLSQGELSEPYQAEIPVQPVAQRVEYPPPAPLIEQRPPPPARHYVWIDGYWSWGLSSWLWAPGYWCAPRYGYSYVPGSWYWANNYWWYGPGGWARPGSTYIVYNVGPRRDRYGVTRSFRPHRTTRMEPSRIGTTAQPSYVGRNDGPARMGATPYPTRFSNDARPARMGAAPYPTHLGNDGRPARMGAALYPTQAGVDSRPARMGAASADRGYNRAPAAGFTPAPSPIYRYPTTVAPAARPSRMGALRSPGSFSGGGGGFSRLNQPSTGTPQRFGTSSASPGSLGAPSTVRSSPMGRMPSASPAPSRAPMGRMGGGGGVGRMGGGGGGGGGGRMGGGGGRGPGTIRR